MKRALAFLACLAALQPALVAAQDSTRSLNTPPWWQLDAAASAEWFASRLTPWQWHSVAVRYRGRTVSHGVEAFTATRHGSRNSGFALEEAIVLGRGAYVELRGQLAPGATVVARRDLAATLYQSFGRGWEIIPSARVMSYSNDQVTVLGLGVGHYIGLWYLMGRAHQASQAGERGVSTSARVRRYRADASPDFIDASVSLGNEIAVLGPSNVALRRTTSAAVRGQRMVTRSIGASLALNYETNASLPDRRGASIATFLRW